MSFETWTQKISKGIRPRDNSIPKNVMWKYEVVDEDLEESD